MVLNLVGTWLKSHLSAICESCVSLGPLTRIIVYFFWPWYWVIYQCNNNKRNLAKWRNLILIPSRLSKSFAVARFCLKGTFTSQWELSEYELPSVVLWDTRKGNTKPDPCKTNSRTCSLLSLKIWQIWNSFTFLVALIKPNFLQCQVYINLTLRRERHFQLSLFVCDLAVGQYLLLCFQKHKISRRRFCSHRGTESNGATRTSAKVQFYGVGLGWAYSGFNTSFGGGRLCLKTFFCTEDQRELKLFICHIKGTSWFPVKPA